nr:PREDICTED: uncharacterized protein LOC107079731 [Lepisosteus oculatus]
MEPWHQSEETSPDSKPDATCSARNASEDAEKFIRRLVVEEGQRLMADKTLYRRPSWSPNIQGDQSRSKMAAPVLGHPHAEVKGFIEQHGVLDALEKVVSLLFHKLVEATNSDGHPVFKTDRGSDRYHEVESGEVADMLDREIRLCRLVKGLESVSTAAPDPEPTPAQIKKTKTRTPKERSERPPATHAQDVAPGGAACPCCEKNTAHPARETRKPAPKTAPPKAGKGRQNKAAEISENTAAWKKTGGGAAQQPSNDPRVSLRRILEEAYWNMNDWTKKGVELSHKLGILLTPSERSWQEVKTLGVKAELGSQGLLTEGPAPPHPAAAGACETPVQAEPEARLPGLDSAMAAQEAISSSHQLPAEKETAERPISPTDGAPFPQTEG